MARSASSRTVSPTNVVISNQTGSSTGPHSTGTDLRRRSASGAGCRSGGATTEGSRVTVVRWSRSTGTGCREGRLGLPVRAGGTALRRAAGGVGGLGVGGRRARFRLGGDVLRVDAPVLDQARQGGHDQGQQNDRERQRGRDLG